MNSILWLRQQSSHKLSIELSGVFSETVPRPIKLKEQNNDKMQPSWPRPFLTWRFNRANRLILVFRPVSTPKSGNVATCMRHAAATNSQADDGLAMSPQFSPNRARYFRRRSASFGELLESRDTENSCRPASDIVRHSRQTRMTAVS